MRVGKEAGLSRKRSGLSDLLRTDDLIRLRTLLALHDVEFDFITFLEALVPLDLDGTVMNEDVRSVVASDKTIALGVVKPLHLTLMLSHVPLPFLTADCGWVLPTCLQ